MLHGAFVDDEVFFLVAKTAAWLDDAIDKLLETVATTFHLLDLLINYKQGKTECFLKCRGHGATAGSRK